VSDFITALPALSPSAGIEEIRRWLQDFQTSYSARDPNAAGDTNQKYLTYQGALDLGLIEYSSGSGNGFGPGPGGGGGGGTDPGDLTPPDPITGLTAVGGLSMIVVEFDAPTYTQGGGNALTEIYGAIYSGTGPLPTFASAKVVYTCAESTSFAAIPVEPGTTMHFWAGAVTRNGVRQVDSTGPTGGTNGVSATSALDVTTLLDALTAAAQNSGAPYSQIVFRADLFYVGNAAGTFEGIPFFVTTTTITQNGVSVPPGVYIRDAFIANGTIDNAMIGNAVITDAKVANLSAGKLTSGTIAVGSVISSSNYVAGTQGWRINGNGEIEAQDATIRGSIFASDGDIGGILINSGDIQSSNYTAGVDGFRFTSLGTGQVGGILMDTTGIRSNNFTTGVDGFRLLATGVAEFSQVTVRGAVFATSGLIGGIDINSGDIRSTNFVAGSSGFRMLSTGVAEFQDIIARGNIEATSLNAGSANIVNTLNIAGNAVTIPVGGTATLSDPDVSQTVDTDGAPLGICVGGVVFLSANTPNSSVTVRVILNGVTRKLRTFSAPTGAAASFDVSLVDFISLTSGSPSTVRLFLDVNTGSLASGTEVDFFALVAKK
jgi:hypothetical protein